MKVALNCGVAGRGSSGASVSLQQIREALDTTSAVELQLLEKRTPRSGSSIGNAIADGAWDFWHAPRAAEDGTIIVHPANTGRGRAGVRSCVVMHDTMALDHPSWFDPKYAAYARLAFPMSARSADLILTPANATRSRILRRWPCAPVRVLPWPVRIPGVTRPRTAPPSWQVLMVGATEPHKRHLMGIEVVRLVRIATGFHITLRIVGSPGRSEAAVRRATRILDPLSEWIRREEHLSTAELVKSYDDAWLLLAPSAEEGFCLPLVEAGARSLPIVHAGTEAMEEVMPGSAAGEAVFELAAMVMELLDCGTYKSAAERVWKQACAFTFDTFQGQLMTYLGDMRL